MQKNKLVISSDNHLSFKQYGLQQREDDFNYAFEQITNFCLENNYDLLLAGDILDTKYPKPHCIQLLSKIHAKFAAKKLYIYCISGNHDNAEPNWLQILSDASFSDKYGFYCIDNKTVTTDCGKTIAGIPYQHSRNSYQVKFDDLTNVDILLMHHSVEEIANASWGNELKINELPTHKAKLIVCGDTHVPKVIEQGTSKILSPGSTEFTSINETDEKFIWEYTKDELLISINLNTRKILYDTIENNEELQQLENKFKKYTGTRLYIKILCNIDFKDKFLKILKENIKNNDIVSYSFHDTNIKNVKQSIDNIQNNRMQIMQSIIAEKEENDRVKNILSEIIKNKENIESTLQHYFPNLKSENVQSNQVTNN